MQEEEYICPICTQWIYYPRLDIDYKQSLKWAKLNKHDNCIEICKNIIKNQNKNIKVNLLVPNPNIKN